MLTSEATATGIPAPVNCATVPLLAVTPEQSALVKISTWVGFPTPSVPLSLGLLSAEGLAGSVAVIVGGSTRSGTQLTVSATVALEPPFRV